jgi:hypothetical protein
MYNYTDEQILAAAKAAHECNRAFCVAIGDNSQVPWEWAEQWQRDSAVAGVQGVLNGNTPEQQHAMWSNHKLADGWKYGPVKDAAKKEHPCLVDYYDLSFEQKAKDAVYVTVVRSVLDSLRAMEETLPGV